MRSRLIPLLILTTVLVLVAGLAVLRAGRPPAVVPQEGQGDLLAGTPSQRAAEFIGFYRDIKLDAAQTAVWKEALSTIPAPCCLEYSIATCCCPCNLAKSVWGLSNYLIAKQGLDAAGVQAKVKEWIAGINPDGLTADACHRGSCGEPINNGGCGGMKEEDLL